VVTLPQLVDAVVETVIGDRSGISVAVEVPQVELSINRELLRFALRNLVENAVEHNDNPSPRVIGLQQTRIQFSTDDES
jgi:signal transduction histidine kinase